MKTAQEIAVDTLHDQHPQPDERDDWHLDLPVKDVLSLMAKAIEADRAQRVSDYLTASEAVEGETLKPGDVVELTGVTWDEYGMRGIRVTLTKADEFNCDDQWWAVFTTDIEDFSVTKVDVL